MNLNRPIILASAVVVIGIGLWFITHSMEQELMDPGMSEHSVQSIPKPVESTPVARPSQVIAVQSSSLRSSQEKLALLDSILTSRDDNDPRLDRDLKILTTDDKRAFMDRYRSIPREDRNARGMIVFLIGRNLTSPEDFNFINSVFLEPYCRSLEDCEKGPALSAEDPHHSSGDEVTQSYPQWAAIKALEKWSENATPELKQNALDALKTAEGFDHPKIQGYARKLYEKLGG